jgi:hypothetical protein
VLGIHRFLIEEGRVRRRKYRVADLRKFPEFARILGFQDRKNYPPDKILEFTIPHGRIENFFLHEIPILPKQADIQLLHNASYIIDTSRPIPPELQKIVDQAQYWEINEFKPLP